jgi:hypothetical protein
MLWTRPRGLRSKTMGERPSQESRKPPQHAPNDAVTQQDKWPRPTTIRHSSVITRIGELARLWGLGRETVRKLVKDDPGVLKIRVGKKRAHTFYSIPSISGETNPDAASEPKLAHSYRIATIFSFGLSVKASLRI